jgi:hypothetical protein
VWFTGSTAVRKGMGLCYDLDVADTGTGETATDPWGRRGRLVAVPSTSNNLAFAGYATQAYPAKTGGQTIHIWEPGSICDVEVGLASTIFSQSAGTRHTVSVNSADAGRSTLDGLPGRGSAIALETQARADGGNIAFASLDGTATTAWVSPSLTITKTAIGTACGYGDDDIDPTEFKVVVLGGADDTYGGDATSGELAVQGEYAVVTAPTADTITIATDIGDVDVTCYVIKNTYPCILCKTEDGPESGLQQVLTPQDAVAVQSMIGGTTFLCGGYTMAADSTATLADGIVEGQLKAFACLGALGTQDWIITVTSGLKRVGTGTLASLEFDAANDFAVLQWFGNFGPGTTGLWSCINTVGPTEA